MLCYEKALYENGVELIAGIDEVGWGPLAGPVGGSCGYLAQWAGKSATSTTPRKSPSPSTREFTMK